LVCIETLKKLIMKNKDLNEITLLKEDHNYKNGFIYKVLSEIIKKNNRITEFIKAILSDINELNDIKEDERVNSYLKMLIDDNKK